MIYYEYSMASSKDSAENFTVTEVEDISQITSSIYLSGFRGASNLDELKKRNIKYIVNCTKSVSNYFEKKDCGCGLLNQTTSSSNDDDIQYLRVPIDDMFYENISNYFDTTYEFIEKSVRENKGILVHCHAGISRSSTILIAYFMRLNKWTYKEAYDFVKSKRSIIDPNIGFKKSLLEFEKKIFNVSIP
jgi:atypical dual specificity phosphatase